MVFETVYFGDWLEAELRPTLIQIIARVTPLIFVGPELSRDPAWLDITVTYFAKSNAALKEHWL
ncbi:KR domain-containing protein [Colletotrichum higginsianum]|nr:KR domain-containing protein [Colletotrichum higginsianum]